MAHSPGHPIWSSPPLHALRVPLVGDSAASLTAALGPCPLNTTALPIQRRARRVRIRTRIRAGVGAAAGELVEEGPRLARTEGVGAAVTRTSILRRGDVALVKGHPAHGVARTAASVGRADVRERALGGLARVLRRAAVETDVLVAHGAGAGDGGDAVADAMDAEVGDGRVAAGAAGHLATGEDGDGAEHVGAGAGEGVRLLTWSVDGQRSSCTNSVR